MTVSAGATPVLVGRGAGEVVGDSADRRVEILSDDDALHATWSRFGPGREGADLHVHRRHTDLFYVLEGELTIRLGPAGEGVAVPAGTLARVPPLVVHGFRNASDAQVAYLNLHAPGQGFAAYMRAIRDGRTLTYDQEPPPPDGGRPTTEAVVGGDGFETDAPGLHTVLLADVEEIGISEVRSDRGSPPGPPHLHRRHVESFYVLEGEIALTTGDRELRAKAGSWAQVPPGAPHAISLPGSEPVRYLNLHTPSCGFGAFLHAFDDTGDEELAAAGAGIRPAAGALGIGPQIASDPSRRRWTSRSAASAGLLEPISIACDSSGPRSANTCQRCSTTAGSAGGCLSRPAARDTQTSSGALSTA